MTLFDMIILNFLFLVVSLSFSSIFQMYEKGFNDKKNYLYLDLALVSAFYLILKYGVQSYYELTLLFLNIPILISALKSRKLPFIAMSIFAVAMYHMNYPNLLFLFLLEYGIYIIIYYFLRWKFVNKEKRRAFFFLIFLISKLLMTIYLNGKIDYQLISTFIGFCLVITTIMYLSKKTESFLQVTFSVKKLEEEKDVRTSLFKITHEIKNPIAVCNGYLQMFDVNKLEHSKNYIPIIRDEIDKVLALLEDFLSITKIKVQKDIIDIYYLLEEVTSSLKPILKEKNIGYYFDIPEDEIYMEADYNRLNQVFINLIKNSMEAMPNGGEISLYTKINNDFIHIYLRDNGEGISKENIKNMNEPFFTTKKKGTGLGVYLSKEIIKAHHGKIYYDSVINKGTTVHIKLPIKKDISYS